MVRMMMVLMILAVLLAMAAPFSAAEAGVVYANLRSETGAPLCGDQGAYANLFLITELGREWVTSDTAEYGEACDDGLLVFTDQELATISDGTYEIEASAANHLIARERVEVVYGYGNAGLLTLRTSPVSIEMVEYPAQVSSYGGVATFTYQVRNVSSEPLQVTAYAEVCGAGSTVGYACVAASIRRSFMLAPGEYRELLGAAGIDSDQPDEWYSGVITVHARRDGWSQFGQIYFNFKKGKLPDGKG